MSIIPNISPELFSFSAVAVGYLLIDDATANEQNALGNWLMLVAQVLCTNAYFQQVQRERGISNQINNWQFAQNNFANSENDIIMLTKIINAMQKEIDEIKKSMI